MFITITIHFLDVSTNFSDLFVRCSTVEARGRNTSLRQQPIRREATAFPEARKPIDERIADEARFFKAWFENPSVTGGISLKPAVGAGSIFDEHIFHHQAILLHVCRTFD